MHVLSTTTSVLQVNTFTGSFLLFAHGYENMQFLNAAWIPCTQNTAILGLFSKKLFSRNYNDKITLVTDKSENVVEESLSARHCQKKEVV